MAFAHPRPIVAAIAVLAGLAGLMTACSDDTTSENGATAAAVRPFSDVQGSEFVFQADPTDPQRAVFRVTSTEPMICAIVWGETEAFGRFNNSLSMNGTGIVDHDVYLPGAEPGRTYFYRVQGSTADGTLYRSETATFTVPGPTGEAAAPSSTVVRSPNLAKGATVVEVSSEFDGSYAASNAVDDNGSTEWSTRGDGDDAFITLDLGVAQPIGAVEYVTRAMADGSAITNTYTVSIDGQAPLGPFPAATAARAAPARLDAVGRLVRFDVETSTGGNVGAVDVRVSAP